MRVVGIADTDSYVKWSAALLGGAPRGWAVSLFILETPLVVSERQRATALAGSGMDAAAVRRGSFESFVASLAADPPDAVVIGARGPLVRVVARAVAENAPRAVMVTGLPGVAIPATRKALVYRSQCDLFVVHSHRERRAFTAVAEESGLVQDFALATLPFAAHAQDGSRASRSGGTDLVFAAQALVPRERAERLRVARLLVRAAEADPSRRVVVKVRGTKGEQQTHAERDAYPGLLAELGPLPQNLVVSSGPMQAALDEAEGLVTISSTAAIEALARGIPVIALDSFGVARELINEVFAESGLLGGDADVCARRFRHPAQGWPYDNYLHDRADDDWASRLSGLVRLRREGSLPARPARVRRGGRLRDAWERKIVLGSHDRSPAGVAALVVGVPLRVGLRALNRVRRALRGEDSAVSTQIALGIRDLATDPAE
ncbi:hypothetical protein GCM10009739_00390 [Microbacterium ulmi]